MNISIDQIKVGKRTRKYLGDIDALAKSIDEVGLLHPIVLDKEYKLIAGRRRIEAFKKLGRDKIDGRIVSNLTEAYDLLKAERDENVCRMDFVRTEALALAERLESMERKAAAERQRQAGIANLPTVSSADSAALIGKGESRDKIAKAVGVSHDTLKKIKEVVEAAKENPELFNPIVDQMDETGNVNKAHKAVNLLRRKQREQEETKKATEIPATILQKDCLDALDNVQPIDLLITDPPYFTDGDFTCHVSKYLAKVKSTGQAYVFLSADPQEIAAYIAMNCHDLQLTQILVWNYNNTGQRQPLVRYTSNYQLCFYYRGKDAPDINRPADGKEQYACQTVDAPDGRLGNRYHEWQKPDKLVERFIRNSSKEGDFVFDPFAGTGTVLISAAKLGRKAAGCDIDERAVKICVERGCNLGV